jgi:hypothetical protein
LTRATIDVLKALLWQFHNAHSGVCFPGYETIAKAAECCRDTVCEAIKALERAGILTWVNRVVSVNFHEKDLFGQNVLTTRVIRTSNSYEFLATPLEVQGGGGCAARAPGSSLARARVFGGRNSLSGGGSAAETAKIPDHFSKSEIPSVTENQDLLILTNGGDTDLTGLSDPLARALATMKKIMDAKK